MFKRADVNEDGNITSTDGGIILQKNQRDYYNEISLACGESLQLKTYNPTASNVEWKSDNTDVATVDTNGKVTLRKAGQVKITVTAGTTTDNICIKIVEGHVVADNTTTKFILGDVDSDGYLTYNDARMILRYNVEGVTVVEQPKADINGDGYIDSTDASIVLREYSDYCNRILIDTDVQLKVLNTEKEMIWESNNTGVAEVDENGNVTVKGEGNCIITARSETGFISDTFYLSGSSVDYSKDDFVGTTQKNIMIYADNTATKDILGDVNGDGYLTTYDANMVNAYEVTRKRTNSNRFCNV